MGYVLINGKRYYQDSRGNVSLDNVSQEEADRRERGAALSPAERNRARSEAFNHSSSRRNTAATRTRQSVRLLVVTATVVTALAAGAFAYNQIHESPAEKAIADYMRELTEKVTEEEDTASEIPETEAAGISD